ncbi:hypothetical protein RRG08_037613 [Elysia crispata]|uniref:Uncharacterized protein n=1 Tax=Elysia crispata TaxID=231223 RepID=A0AAE0YGJ8_9GAST|nr:hypothetical protein RRG08_037613 [Elysia crispata]
MPHNIHAARVGANNSKLQDVLHLMMASGQERPGYTSAISLLMSSNVRACFVLTRTCSTEAPQGSVLKPYSSWGVGTFSRFYQCDANKFIRLEDQLLNLGSRELVAHCAGLPVTDDFIIGPGLRKGLALAQYDHCLVLGNR